MNTYAAERDFVPLIFEGAFEREIPEGFNAVSVFLNGAPDSDLHWEKQKVFAFEKKQEGYRFLWDLHLGLFQELPLPLSSTAQYKSLRLAIEHFFEHFGKDFAEHTIGVSFYKGPIDMIEKWNFDADQLMNLKDWLIDHFKEEASFVNATGLPCHRLSQIDPLILKKSEVGRNILRFYCFGVAIDYFDLLAASFPGEAEPYVLFDTHGISSPTHLFQLLHAEDTDFLRIALKGSAEKYGPYPGWNDQRTSAGYIGSVFKPYRVPTEETVRGVVIPEALLWKPEQLRPYDELIERLQRIGPVRPVSEKKMTTEWGGLEDLFVLSIQETGKRKLEGFIAAGGRVISPEGHLGLTEEMSFSSFFKEVP